MKRFVYMAMAAAVLLGASSCKNLREEDSGKRETPEKQSPETTDTFTIKAVLEDTRSQLDGVQVLWSEGDAVKIFNAANPAGEVYTLSDGAGTSNAHFTGNPLSGSGPYYAVYPASAADALSGNSVSVNLPQIQVLTAGSFGNGANISMAETDDMEASFQFKNALGAVSFTLDGNPSLRQIRVQAKGEEALWGSGSLQMAEGVPTLSLDPADTDHQAVYLDGTAQTGVFYMMLPPDALAGGFMAQFVNAEDMAMVKSAPASEANRVQRNTFLAMPSFSFDANLKASFLEPDTFTFGSFNNIGESGAMQAFTFDKLTCQYAYRTDAGESRYLRLQSLQLGRYFSVTAPYSQALGASGNMSVTTLEGSSYGTATANYRLVKSTNQGAWYVCEDMQKGFILLLEE